MCRPGLELEEVLRADDLHDTGWRVLLDFGLAALRTSRGDVHGATDALRRAVGSTQEPETSLRGDLEERVVAVGPPVVAAVASEETAGLRRLRASATVAGVRLDVLGAGQGGTHVWGVTLTSPLMSLERFPL